MRHEPTARVVAPGAAEGGFGAAAAAGVAIRTALPAEYPAIDRLISEAYEADYGPQEEAEFDCDAAAAGKADRDPVHEASARAARFDLWVAVDPDGRVLGSVTTRRAGGPPLHEDVRDDELDVRLLGVSPAARRRGIAAALMQAVVDRARTAGFAAVVLKTAPNMVGAHRLYETLGFARDAPRDGLWIGGEKVLELRTYALPVGVASGAAAGPRLASPVGASG
ncbi:GNAT family N-acetyltransferase [Leucobacter sp. CSA2]|uniref:GNAT family N-acetyltransferase n=1 Tax=Leucobacter edaphi TaxID=2796472 RepID=A0A934UWJ4_9MICO|nr:GNAT family N-acetyltransferase [Leucobacter edaphi]MBK0421744.1 GNAT family N-acetyltransferase [Leucobacter edaphi]